MSFTTNSSDQIAATISSVHKTHSPEAMASVILRKAKLPTDEPAAVVVLVLSSSAKQDPIDVLALVLHTTISRIIDAKPTASTPVKCAEAHYAIKCVIDQMQVVNSG